MNKKLIAILRKLFLLNWPYLTITRLYQAARQLLKTHLDNFYQFHIFSIIYNLFCGIEIWVDIEFIGGNCYGPNVTCADFVMSRNDPEPLIGVRTRTGFGEKSQRSISTKTATYRPIERIFKDLHTG